MFSFWFIFWRLVSGCYLFLVPIGKSSTNNRRFLLNSGAMISSGNFITKETNLLWLKLTVFSFRTIECFGWSQELCSWEVASSGGVCCHSLDDSWKLLCLLWYEGSGSQQYRRGATVLGSEVLWPGLQLTGFVTLSRLLNFSKPRSVSASATCFM